MTGKYDVKARVKNCNRVFFEMTNVLIQVDPKYLKRLTENIVKKLNGKISNEDAVKKFWLEQNQSERDRIIQNYFNVPIPSFWDALKCMGDDMNDNTIPFPDTEKLEKIKKVNTLFLVFDSQAEFKIKNALNEHKIPFDSVLMFDKLRETKCESGDMFVVNSAKAISCARSKGVTPIYIDRHHTKPNMPFSFISIESLAELV